MTIITNNMNERIRARSSSSQGKDPYIPDGIQSGPDSTGTTFVSSSSYNPYDHTIVLTGNTWGRYFESHAQYTNEEYDEQGMTIPNPIIPAGCFVAAVTLPDYSNQKEQSTKMEFVAKLRLHGVISKNGRTSDEEVCNTLHLYHNNTELIVVGHETKKSDSSITESSGMVFDLTYKSQNKLFELHGGKMLTSGQSRYPIATTNFVNDDNNAYIVFIEDDDNISNQDNINRQDISGIDTLQNDMNHHDPSKYFKYKSGTGFGIARYQLMDVNEGFLGDVKKMDQIWFQTYATGKIDNNNNPVFCVVKDIVAIRQQSNSIDETDGVLLIAGTTNGIGEAFGKSTSSDNGATRKFGFLTKISAKGVLIDSIRIPSTPEENGEDSIGGLCHAPSSIDSKHVYVVGSSKSGKGSYSFLYKVEVDTMKIIWNQQIHLISNNNHDETTVTGISCAVTPDGQSIWVGGTVDNDGIIAKSGLQNSFGKKDIYVARYRKSGQLEFVHQMGTNENDDLAINGGITTDHDGNAIVVGNTYGNLFRERNFHEQPDYSDVFVLTVSRASGQIKAPVDHISGLTVLEPLFHYNANSGLLQSSVIYCFLVIGFLIIITVQISNRVQWVSKGKHNSKYN